MKKTNCQIPMLISIIACVVLGPIARAQELPDADLREVSAYTLTEAGLAKYMAATRNLRGIKVEDCDDSEVTSLTEAAAKVDAVPGAKAAMQAAGITNREYVVFAFSMVQNGIAANGLEKPGAKLPAGTNPANVEFFRKHAAEMQQLANEPDVGGCDDGDGD